MIEEAYCSFEVAKLLKEKGFEILTDKVYDNQNKLDYQNVVCWQEKRLPYISAPTQAMAMAWLREVYQLHISIDVYPIYGKVKDGKGRNICSLLYWNYIAGGEWMNDKYNSQQKAFVVSEKSYKKAVEAALKYTLENLL